ncbi:glycerol dehydratase reactivase beta/small subunit family protein [Clostridium magnum]|uniref:Dehydratase medium subunit n=1 Tax=Clostridium magnum DSM 2767 TaxID=1121326 RepID=A0A162S1U3_9CLOT|nr:glycerol dehydratase reactivase beta/small subunit family protein [Clostridium magnum]KZL90670.1 hypothetical protein CLMAG_35700 [Clostridium magnum DSM 2767]SHI39418.1 Dehydratase medium subunit [Clostridium magnum DSM 2767]
MIANNLEIPCIFVCINNLKEPFLKEILAGIEEEGIPYNVKNINFNESTILREVYTAAQESRMGIAIGVIEGRLVLHFNKLKEEKPLVDIKLDLYEKEKARIVGCNAARLYKIMPFKDIESVNMELLEKVRASVIAVINKLNIKIT